MVFAVLRSQPAFMRMECINPKKSTTGIRENCKNGQRSEMSMEPVGRQSKRNRVLATATNKQKTLLATLTLADEMSFVAINPSPEDTGTIAK